MLPIVRYGSSIWRQYQFSSINSVHNKEGRYVLDVNKTMTNAAVQGDIGLGPPGVKWWASISH